MVANSMVLLWPVAVFKFWGPGPFFICGALRENVENSWGSGGAVLGGVWKCLDFDPIQAILGPSVITLGHILQAAFEDMGGYFFDFDLIKTILGTPGTTLRHLAEYFWTFWQMHWGGGGGGGKSARPFLGMKSSRPRAMAPSPPPPLLKPPLTMT